MTTDRFDLRAFSVRHDKSTMKVGTDALLLGAWADLEGARRILDVGTGSGLLALMAAQRAPEAWIDAVEIDEASTEQAGRNAALSPWADRVRVHHMDVRRLHASEPFDRIISNPPFHAPQSLSPEVRRSVTRHGSDLTFAELLRVVVRCLSDNGRCALILPAQREKELLDLAERQGLALHRRCQVHYVAGRPARRVLVELGRDRAGLDDGGIIVMEGPDGPYSEAYLELLQEFLIRT
ncbi:MAG: methyltransferase [Flavobacteriales bacterium]|nr:methyltransferase [Flavobacteriales bacterium]MCB9168577.1 methyltransferase [Flavobacteriales bacterium]